MGAVDDSKREVRRSCRPEPSREEAAVASTQSSCCQAADADDVRRSSSSSPARSAIGRTESSFHHAAGAAEDRAGAGVVFGRVSRLRCLVGILSGSMPETTEEFGDVTSCEAWRRYPGRRRVCRNNVAVQRSTARRRCISGRLASKILAVQGVMAKRCRHCADPCSRGAWQPTVLAKARRPSESGSWPWTTCGNRRSRTLNVSILLHPGRAAAREVRQRMVSHRVRLQGCASPRHPVAGPCLTNSVPSSMNRLVSSAGCTS